MTRTMHLNAFDMLVPVHQSPGLWLHPDSRAAEFDQLDYWVGLARTLDQAGFTSLFLADIPGIYDVHGDGMASTARGGVQYPVLDPVVAIPAMARETQNLGFGVTASVTYESPYLLARRLSTLDHFTGGRVAWNIVTSYQDSAARNLGLRQQIPHDQRYDRADEYMEVMYRLFEGSFAEGAVRADAEANVFVDPDRVRGIGHEGRWFSVPGAAMAHPGPQGTPFLFQAGASSRGQQFGVDHAEAVFFSGSSPEMVRGWTQRTRDGLERAGRPRDAIKAFSLATVIVDRTDEAAQARFQEYRDLVDTEAALALFGGWTGVDLAGARPEDTLEAVATEASQSTIATFTSLSPERKWTVRDLAEFVSIGGRGPVLVGSPQTVADELERWQREADVDGFNLCAAVRPADLERCAELLVPELRRRGLLDSPRPGQTLRDRVAGKGDRLPEDHRGAASRW